MIKEITGEGNLEENLLIWMMIITSHFIDIDSERLEYLELINKKMGL